MLNIWWKFLVISSRITKRRRICCDENRRRVNQQTRLYNYSSFSETLFFFLFRFSFLTGKYKKIKFPPNAPITIDKTTFPKPSLVLRLEQVFRGRGYPRPFKYSAESVRLYCNSVFFMRVFKYHLFEQIFSQTSLVYLVTELILDRIVVYRGPNCSKSLL